MCHVPGVLARYRRHARNVTSNFDLQLREVVATLDIIGHKYPRFAREAADYKSFWYAAGAWNALAREHRVSTALARGLLSFRASPRSTWSHLRRFLERRVAR